MSHCHTCIKLEKKKHILTIRTAQHWNSLPRAFLGHHHLWFSSRVRIRSCQRCCSSGLKWAGVWTSTFKVPSRTMNLLGFFIRLKQRRKCLRMSAMESLWYKISRRVPRDVTYYKYCCPGPSNLKQLHWKWITRRGIIQNLLFWNVWSKHTYGLLESQEVVPDNSSKVS